MRILNREKVRSFRDVKKPNLCDVIYELSLISFDLLKSYITPKSFSFKFTFFRLHNSSSTPSKSFNAIFSTSPSLKNVRSYNNKIASNNNDNSINNNNIASLKSQQPVSSFISDKNTF